MYWPLFYPVSYLRKIVLDKHIYYRGLWIKLSIFLFMFFKIINPGTCHARWLSWNYRTCINNFVSSKSKIANLLLCMPRKVSQIFVIVKRQVTDGVIDLIRCVDDCVLSMCKTDEVNTILLAIQSPLWSARKKRYKSFILYICRLHGCHRSKFPLSCLHMAPRSETNTVVLDPSIHSQLL